MNSVMVLNDFYNLYNSDPFLSNVESILDSSDERNKQIADMKAALEKEEKMFEELKSKIPVISNLFDLPTRIGISSQIDTVIGDLKNAQANFESYLSGKNISPDKIEQSLINLDYSSKGFDDIFNSAYKNFGETLYFAFKTNEITLKDLEEMQQKDGMTPEQIKDIQRVVEKIKIELGPRHYYDANMAEQTAIEDEKGKESSNTENNVSEVAKQRPTPVNVSERVNSVEYQSGVNYADAVAEVRVQAELDRLDAQINRLKGKEKLTFSEAVQLQTLIKQSLALEEMAFTQSISQMRREGKLASMDNRISEQAERLEQEKQNTSQSKLFKYMSARKQHQLQEKLKQLEGKMVVIQQQQRMSTLVRFDKANNKLAKKAKREATRQVIMTTTKENIEKLKAFGNKVVRFGKDAFEEGKNIASDVSRFVSNSALMEKLRGQQIIMEGEPSILELPEPEQVLAAHM